ncbi:MAG: lysoplasmalogenase [Clostridiales bacterium]|nr:lysoplasmalogenase [Clostridiales bacterium]
MTVILMLIAALFFVLYMTSREKGFLKTVYKCVPTACACILAVYLAIKGNADAGKYLAVSGLALCVFADAVLEHALIPGAALFGAAHVCFILYHVLARSHGIACAVCFVLVFTLLCLLFVISKEDKPQQAPLWGFVLYAFLLALMTAMSIDGGPWLALGGLLFAFSDTVLFLRMFGKLSGRAYSWLLMGAYYLALFLIATGSCG